MKSLVINIENGLVYALPGPTKLTIEGAVLYKGPEVQDLVRQAKITLDQLEAEQERGNRIRRLAQCLRDTSNMEPTSRAQVVLEFIEKENAPEPELQVGDTVFVPEGATFDLGGFGGRAKSSIPAPCEARVTRLDDGDGNLELSHGGQSIYLVHPDQVTWVQP